MVDEHAERSERSASSSGGEFERIETILARFGRGRGAGFDVLVSNGDDAAVFALGAASAVSVDASVEHVHFERRWLAVDEIAFRATMAALSDLAAVRARARAVFSSWTLPRSMGDDEVSMLARGVDGAARSVGARVLGGNLTRGAELALHTTVIGETARPLARSGARVGDVVFTTGPLGHAALGLRALMADRASDPALSSFVRRWRMPLARLDVALDEATAGIDVSDGLVADVRHLATASGVLIELDEALLKPNEAFMEGAQRLGLDALELTLSAGEDYEVVGTAPRAPVRTTIIGRVVAGSSGVQLRTRSGALRALDARGFQHFG